MGDIRKITVSEPHFSKGKITNFSQTETFYSEKLLKMLLKAYKNYFIAGIERDTGQDTFFPNVKRSIDRFHLELRGKRILDFGCGTGSSTIALHRLGASSVVGVDINKEHIEVAKQKVKEWGFSSDIELLNIEPYKKLPFKNESFDIIFCIAVIEHIPPLQRKKIIRDLWRLLKKNGYFVIIESPNRLWPKDDHTTGLWFLPYLPVDIAALYARKLSPGISVNTTLKELYLRGFRGISTFEIKYYLRFDEYKILNQSNRELREYFFFKMHKNEGKIKHTIKLSLRFTYHLLYYTICKPFNIPLSSFFPEINICLKKIGR